jgi:hypothetical protein
VRRRAASHCICTVNQVVQCGGCVPTVYLRCVLQFNSMVQLSSNIQMPRAPRTLHIHTCQVRCTRGFVDTISARYTISAICEGFTKGRGSASARSATVEPEQQQLSHKHCHQKPLLQCPGNIWQEAVGPSALLENMRPGRQSVGSYSRTRVKPANRIIYRKQICCVACLLDTGSYDASTATFTTSRLKPKLSDVSHKQTMQVPSMLSLACDK